MQVQVFNATPVAYGSYEKQGQPMRYERGDFAGQTIDFVDLMVPGGEDGVQVVRMTLAPTINGDRPGLGTGEYHVLASLTLVDTMAAWPDGRPRVMQRPKWRCEAFASTAAPQADKTPATAK
jgi:hypothetical protein